MAYGGGQPLPQGESPWTQPNPLTAYGDGASRPGTLLNDMANAGINIGQTGAARLLMSGARQDAFGGTLSNDQLIAATRQGVNQADLGKVRYNKDAKKWELRNGTPYVSPGNQFNYGQYGK